MQVQNLSLFKGFITQSNETELDNPLVIGDIPQWLSGDFVSNGPAQFEIGATHFNHWFDGFAMLKKFNFKSGKVSFQNRFLRSKHYETSLASGQLSKNEFATYANTSLLGRIRHSIRGLIKSDIYDNCNINTTCIGEHFIAMTESSDVIEFKLSDLSTIGLFKFADSLRGQLTSAHPQLDIIKGELINVAIEIGRVSKYHIYKMDHNSKRREIIKTYITDKLFYMHSFSITSNYIVLFKSPLILNKFKLIMGFPFNDALTWQKNTSSFFIVIDRRNGTIREIEIDAFVCLHSANAYENGNELILDLICHDKGNPFSYLYLSNLQSEQPDLSSGILRRYIIDINSKRCEHTNLSANYHEFPRVNYKTVNGKKYNFLFTNSIENPGQKFFNSIQKLNVQTGKIQCWKKSNYYPGEVVFVGKNNNTSEDDGILLTIAYNASNQCSSLVILDANTMQQTAEVFLPFHLPFGLHGNFYNH